MTTSRVTTNAGAPVPSSLSITLWNGAGTVPPEFTATSAALITAFATIFIQVFDQHGLPVPNAPVYITFEKASAATLTEVAFVAAPNVNGIVTGFGTVDTLGIDNWFGGIQSLGSVGTIAQQSSMTHLIKANANGQVALKFAAAPATTTFSSATVVSGAARATFPPTVLIGA